MRVLFIGGTGVISSSCAEPRWHRGLCRTLLNRGRSDTHPGPRGCREVVHADIRDRAAQAALAGRTFDAVVDWVAFKPEHVEADIELFRGRTGQYVFISSASAYQKPPSSLPITESTLLDNPFWQYCATAIAQRSGWCGRSGRRSSCTSTVRPSQYPTTRRRCAGRGRLDGRTPAAPGQGGRRAGRRHCSGWPTHARVSSRRVISLLGNAAIGGGVPPSPRRMARLEPDLRDAGARRGCGAAHRPRAVHGHQPLPCAMGVGACW